MCGDNVLGLKKQPANNLGVLHLLGIFFFWTSVKLIANITNTEI